MRRRTVLVAALAGVAGCSSDRGVHHGSPTSVAKHWFRSLYVGNRSRLQTLTHDDGHTAKAALELDVPQEVDDTWVTIEGTSLVQLNGGSATVEVEYTIHEVRSAPNVKTTRLQLRETDHDEWRVLRVVGGLSTR